MTPGPDMPGDGQDEGQRMNWRKAALVIGIMSAAGWGLIILVSGWLLG